MINHPVIENLLHEHEAVRAYMGQITKMVNSWYMSKSTLASTPDVGEDFERQKLSLKQTIGYLDDGLKRQFMHEEEVMPQLVGDMLMDAVKAEHAEILKELSEIKFLLLYINPASLKLKGDYLKVLINSFVNWVTRNSVMKDIMLRLVRGEPARKIAALASV